MKPSLRIQLFTALVLAVAAATACGGGEGSSSAPGTQQPDFQTGIVAVGGTLYFTAFGNTYAIDGATCQPKWKHSVNELR